MPINSVDARPAYGTSYLKGSLDASLAANLPAVKLVGDIYDISAAGSFEDDASILPAAAYFSVPDQIRWNGTNWVKMESGDNISDAAFDASWDGNVNNAPSKNAVYDEVIKKVNILDASTSGFGFVVDEDDMASDSNTKVPTQQSVKAYIAPIKTKVDQQDATNDVATQTYTIQNTDHGKTLFFTYAGAVTITAPQSLADTVHVTCVPVGAATTLAFVAGAGATLNSKGGLLNVTDQYSPATAVHRGSNAWYLFGNLS